MLNGVGSGGRKEQWRAPVIYQSQPKSAPMFADASDNVCSALGNISCPFCQAVLLDSSQNSFYDAWSNF